MDHKQAIGGERNHGRGPIDWRSVVGGSGQVAGRTGPDRTGPGGDHQADLTRRRWSGRWGTLPPEFQTRRSGGDGVGPSFAETAT